MILITDSAAKANPAALKRLAEKRDVVIVRDCDYAIAVEIMLKQKYPPN